MVRCQPCLRSVRMRTMRDFFIGPLFLRLACAAPSMPPSNQSHSDPSSAVTPTPSTAATASLVDDAEPSSQQQVACRSARVDEGCRAGSPKRPARQKARTPTPIRHSTDRSLFSTNGRDVFYYQQKTGFDLQSFFFAIATDCPLWEDVFAWDTHDVYVLEPQSCGGENCGGDYTGYGWAGVGVRTPAAFHWLQGGYGSDGRFVYNRWHETPPARSAAQGGGVTHIHFSRLGSAGSFLMYLLVCVPVWPIGKHGTPRVLVAR